MSRTASDIIQVHVERISSLYSALVAALSEAGFSGSQLNEISSKCICAECVQCGIRITGEDVARLALAGEKTETPDSRLDRLRQGYCARKDCDSYYYRIHFDDYPNVDWTNIRETAASLSTATQTTVEEEPTKGSNAIRNWLLVRLGVGVAVALVLLLLWHIRYYGYVPLLQKPHKYTIDPASVRAPP